MTVKLVKNIFLKTLTVFEITSALRLNGSLSVIRSHTLSVSISTIVYKWLFSYNLDSVLDNGFKNHTNLMSLDLESFLATMTIPPPPLQQASGDGRPEEKRSNAVLTSEEISSFIIPPPPPKAVVPPPPSKATVPPPPPKAVIPPSVSTSTAAGGVTEHQHRRPDSCDETDDHRHRSVVQAKPAVAGTSASAATTPDGPCAATNEKTLPGFSCCSRPRQRSPDSQPPCLPTRAQNMTLPRVKPKVPPRVDSTLSTKPPLPPMPSQVCGSAYNNCVYDLKFRIYRSINAIC